MKKNEKEALHAHLYNTQCIYIPNHPNVKKNLFGHSMGNSAPRQEKDLNADSSPLIGAVIKEGYLLKRARRSGRNWRRRWVQLVQVDMHSGALVYFDSKPKSVTERPNGRVEIDKNTTCIATRQFTKKPHCFMVSRPDTDYTFYAATSTKTDLHYWVKSVEDLVDKFSKVAFNRQSRKIYTMQGTLRSKVTKRLRQSMIQRSDESPLYDTLEYLNTTTDESSTFKDEIIACGRLHFNNKTDAQIRYMAVDKEFRGIGIGKKIIKLLELKAKEKTAKKVILNARDHVVEFYKK